MAARKDSRAQPATVSARVGKGLGKAPPKPGSGILAVLLPTGKHVFTYRLNPSPRAAYQQRFTIGDVNLSQGVIKTEVSDECCAEFESAVSCPSFKPEWRNWYTHQTQNLASVKDMSVRVRPPAPAFLPHSESAKARGRHEARRPWVGLSISALSDLPALRCQACSRVRSYEQLTLPNPFSS